MDCPRIDELLSDRDAILCRDYGAALDFARLDASLEVLDVGTGSGRMLTELVRRGHSVISGDIDPQAFEKARDRLGRIANEPQFMLMDAHDMHFADGSFQAATFANAIHEISDPRGVIDEIARVLTREGKLLVVEFNSKGFDLMEAHHLAEGKGQHPRGEMTTEDIDLYLRERFDHVESRGLSITNAWIAWGSRQGGKS